MCGGATAWSGGWMWAPGNPLAHADGVHEDVEQFRTYLRAVLGADYDAARVDAFLAAAPEMVRFFHEKTALTFVPGARICDVYGGLPGAGTGHRSVAPAPVDGRTLGDDVLDEAAAPALRDLVPRHGDHGRAGPHGVPLGVARQPPRAAARHPAVRQARLRPADPPPRHAAGQRHRARRPAAALGARPRRGRPGRLAGHRAAARRRRPRDRRRRLHTGRPAADHRRPAASCSRRAGSRRTSPAAGHCSRAPRPAPSTGRWRRATADGAGTTLGESAGGRLRTDVASPAAWCPVSLVPYRSGRVVASHRRVPAHHGPGEAGQHRRAVDGQAVRQRGRRLPRLRHGHDRRGARGRAGAVVADRRLPVRAPLPAGHGQAAPGAAAALPAQRLPQEGPHARGARHGVRDRPGRPGGDRRGVQPATPAAARTRSSGAAARRSTGTAATRRSARTRRSPRWRRARSTRCGSCPAASGRSPGSPPTPAPASWTPTTSRCPACTPWATTRPA